MYVSKNKELHLVKYIFLVQSKKNIPKTHTKKKKDKTTKVLQGNLVIERGSSPKFKLSNSLLVLTYELRSSQTEKIET